MKNKSAAAPGGKMPGQSSFAAPSLLRLKTPSATRCENCGSLVSFHSPGGECPVGSCEAMGLPAPDSAASGAQPCDCGAVGSWHGDQRGLREFCCDACWAVSAGNPERVASPTVSREVLAVLSDLRDYLAESHQEEIDKNHHGDKCPCSYCEAIARADCLLERDGVPIDLTGTKAAPAPSHKSRLAEFGAVVLEILESDEEWSADTTDEISREAVKRGLAEASRENGGLFRRVLPVAPAAPSLYEVITQALIEHFGLSCLPMQATRFACDKYTVVLDALQTVLAAAEECSAEISRVNQAAGHTVFNPAATGLLREALAKALGVFPSSIPVNPTTFAEAAGVVGSHMAGVMLGASGASFPGVAIVSGEAGEVVTVDVVRTQREMDEKQAWADGTNGFTKAFPFALVYVPLSLVLAAPALLTFVRNLAGRGPESGNQDVYNAFSLLSSLGLDL